MKYRYTLLFLPAVFVPLALIAQGPLTPPAGAPAPSMKTLAQVEPRIDAGTLTGDATAVILISAPGSYYLSGNVNVPSGRAGVAISVSDVELDLGGFTITGAAGSVRGVELRNNINNVRIRHGNIAGIATGPGVGLAALPSPDNIRLTDLAIRNCVGGVLLGLATSTNAENVSVTGGSLPGIDLGSRGVASRCSLDGASISTPATVNGIRAGSVVDCQVTGITNQDGRVIGILGEHTQGCLVSSVSGDGSDTGGIQTASAANCKVSSVNTTAGANVLGIQASGQVSQLTVTGVGSNGTAGATGISGGTVTGCHVSGTGGGIAASATGIISLGAVAQCTVSNTGDFNMPGQGTGIIGGQVSQCRVSGLDSRSILLGISAGAVTHCAVQNMTQSGAATTGTVTGIAAQHIIECQVRDLSGATPSNTLGFGSYLLASHCSGSDVVTSGTGNSIGFQASSGGQTVDCFYNGNSLFGVVCGNGCAVRGCSITLGSTGTCISATGTQCVIDSNTLRNATTGINVTGANGLVIRNRVTLCTTNIFTSASSQGGPLISAQGAIASTNPWANFTD